MGNCNLLYKQSNVITGDEFIINPVKKTPGKMEYSREANGTRKPSEDRRTNEYSLSHNHSESIGTNRSIQGTPKKSKVLRPEIKPPIFYQCYAAEHNVESREGDEVIAMYPENRKTDESLVNYNESEIKSVKLIQKSLRSYLGILKTNPFKSACDNVRRNFDFFFKYGNNIAYRGQWVNKKRDGLGMMKWSDGDEYFGMWDKDKMNGIGKYYNNSSGSRFNGYFINDYISIYGIEIWCNGSTFEGEYNNNLKEGLGILNFDDGSYYVGEFRENDIHGYGSFHKTDGAIHQGQFVKNKLNGYGNINSPDEKVFYGQFVNDKKEGFGILYDKIKNWIYMGNWADSKLEGEAIVIENKVIKRFEFKKSKKIRELKNYTTQFEDIAEEYIKTGLTDLFI